MKKIISVLKWGLFIILSLFVLWVIIHQILIRTDAKKLNQRGEYVTVKGRNFNIYKEGDGEKTIVLLPGLGTTAPTLDFEPLAKELSDRFRVVIVEPFGYGWSDNTNDERSVENIVEEIRTALVESGESGPYILMPHSLSGIYSTWYANKYPEEVEAIVGIDCLLPTKIEYFGVEIPHILSLAKVANPIGLQRLICMVSPLSFISDNRGGLYTEDNLNQQKLLSNKVSNNATVINETNAIESNINKTYSMKFEKTMPLLFFTCKIMDKEQGKNSKEFYEKYITNPEIQKVIVLDSSHYMHWTKASDMAEATKQFFYK